MDIDRSDWKSSNRQPQIDHEEQSAIGESSQVHFDVCTGLQLFITQYTAVQHIPNYKPPQRSIVVGHYPKHWKTARLGYNTQVSLG